MCNNELTERDLNTVSGGGFCNTFFGACTPTESAFLGVAGAGAAGAGAGVSPPLDLHPAGGSKGNGGGGGVARY
jgi:hypothetical protein